MEPGMGDTSPSPLTEAQREIMQIVWDRGEVTVTEVRIAIASRRELARNTVQTMMVRLEEKGWLKHREHRRTFLYSANVPRNVSLGVKVAQLVDRFFAGSPENMVSALVEYRGLTKQEAERIRAMIDKAEAKKKSNK
jgi:predicted transcriptional regulator